MRSANFIKTKDISLASGLLSLGIRLEAPAMYVEDQNLDKDFWFYFSEESECGEYRTRDMIKAWYDDGFISDNPEHPFSYIKVAYKNRNSLLDEIKGGVTHKLLQDGGKLILVPANITPENFNKLIR